MIKDEEQSAKSEKRKAYKNKYFCFIGMLFAVGITFIGCERGESRAAGPVFESPIFAVNTTLAVQGQIRDHISFSGDIVAGSTVDVFPEAAGRVTQLHAAVGSVINQGAPIAAVDPSRPGMTFRYNIATAPISGTIVAMPAQVGMMVSQAVPLARIAGGGGLEIRIHVAERFISRMALNLPCEITLDAWPGEVFFGTIAEISPTVDLASRTMEVRVNVHDARGRLRPGMFARVRIITEQKDNVVKIPSSALITRFGQQYVFVITQDEENLDIDIVRQRSIVPGISIDGITEIRSGLAPNDEIVVRGQTLLDDGSRVNIIERVTPLLPRTN